MISSTIDRKHFKKSLNSPSKASRSRMESTIRIRKGKKDEERKRRRAVKTPKDCSDWMIKPNPTDSTADTDLSDDCKTIDPTYRNCVGGKKVRLNTTDENVVIVMTRLREATSQHRNELTNTKSTQQLIDIVQDIRRMLSDLNDPPIGMLLAHGLLPYLTSLIQNHRHPTVLYESIWCFVNISSSNVPSHVEAVALSGVVGGIVNLLAHENSGVCEQAIWFIANMAGENTKYRDALVEMRNVTESLLLHISLPVNISVLSTCAWAISNLFREQGQRSSITSLAARFVPELVSKTSIGVAGRVPASELVDLMTALLSITECGAETRAIVLESGCLPMLIDAISYFHDLPNTTMLLLPAVRIIWQFSAGTEQQTEQVILSGFLNITLKLLQSSKKQIRLYVLLTLSNIAAGTHDQIGKLLQRRPIMKEIVRLANDGSAEIKKQALWTMSNIVTQGSIKQANILVLHECIATFCNYLAASFDNQLDLVVLEAVETLLSQNEKAELGYVEFFEHCNGVQTIEDLQSSKIEKVYEMAVRILVNYFGALEDDESFEDQNMAPLVSAGKTTFEFGMNALPAKQLFPENVEMMGNSESCFPFDGSTTNFY